MDCRHFEAHLEALLAGELPPAERAACERHAEGCPHCRELLELAGAAGGGAPPGAADAGLVGRVLAETSGPACRRAGELLAGRLDRPLADPLDRELLDLHLSDCGDCRALAGVLARLADDLPGLAEIRPDRDFVDDVLAATLPARVRWRRRASSVWSRRFAAWARRPRFAWEAAFVLTLALLPVLASSASPLTSVPTAAREIARENPVPRLGAALDRRVEGTVQALGRAAPLDQADRTVAAARSRLGALGTYLDDLQSAAADTLGTLRDGAASFLTRATGSDDDPPRSSPTETTTTRAGDGSKDDIR